MNDMDKCIDTCKKVIEEGRSKKADFQTIAKAFNRIGNAYTKQEKYAEAIEAYQKSLTESSTPQTLQALRKVEKLKRERDAINYIDPQKSQEEKEKGNEFFKQQKFPEAIASYTEALRRNPKDHVLYSNRAAAYTKLGEFNYAMKDCDESLALNPNFVKSYIRKANLEVVTKQYHKAIETFDKALKIEPDNFEAKEGLQKTMNMVAQQQRSGTVDKEQAARSMADPEIQAILQDPKMRSVLNDLQNDPQAAQHYLSDPVILNNINKLVTAGVLQVK
jgi:stress-induced-phosphoprotein 1